jgi:hypothetical protein
MPGFAPGTLSGRWYAKTLRRIGREGGGGRATGRLAAPGNAADLRAPNFGGEREPGAGLPRMQGIAQRCGSIGTRWPGARLGRLAGRRADGCGAQSLYISVRSVIYDRAESAGAQQLAATGPQAHTGLTVWPAVQVPCDHRREQASVPDQVVDRVVPGDLPELAAAEPERAGVADVSQRGAAPENSIAVSVVPMPGGMAAQAVGDGE